MVSSFYPTLENTMELKRCIYDLRFKPHFAWLDHKGSILQMLQESKIFDSVGQTVNTITAKKSSTDTFKNIVVETQRLSGAIEHDNVGIEYVKEILRLAKITCERINLNTSSIIRFGVRFQFISSTSFEKANEFFIKMISSEITNIVSGDQYVDSAIVPVVKDGNNTIKYALGPIKQAELANYFERYENIDFEEGFMCDIDYFSTDYHSLRMDKFAEDGLSKILSRVNALEELILENVNTK